MEGGMFLYITLEDGTRELQGPVKPCLGLSVPTWVMRWLEEFREVPFNQTFLILCGQLFMTYPWCLVYLCVYEINLNEPLYVTWGRAEKAKGNVIMWRKQRNACE